MRELGESIPISIGTALAFEAQVVVEKPATDMLWMNVRTLWRNFWGSYSKEDRPAFTQLLKPFVEEVNIITSLVDNAGLVPVVYNPSYANLTQLFPGASVKKIETDAQKIYDSAEKAAVAACRGQKVPMVDIRTRMPQTQSRVWLLTHYAIDLLNRYEFTDCQLLESHTGIIKEPIDWNSKLTKNIEYARLPFNILTMQVVGDRGVLFNGLSQSYKKALLTVAQQGRWTPMTTLTKMRSDLTKIPDTAMRDALLKMSRAVLA